MNDAQHVYTIVQISDLHFGTLVNGNVVYDRGLKTLWTLFPALRGMAGHEPAALNDLDDFVSNLRQSEGCEVKVVVTGDLTSTGRTMQFDLAESYLGDCLNYPNGSSGLREVDWRNRAVPGNHDHWPGRYLSVLGPPQSALTDWAADFPAVHPPIEIPTTGLKLRFLAINTDAEVVGWGPERILARGNFVQHLRKLSDQLDELGRPQPDEFRVLLLHHSLSYSALPEEQVSGWGLLPLLLRCDLRALGLGPLEMNLASKAQLRQFLAKHDVPVILTGHTHNPWVQCFFATSTEPRRLTCYLEACCGTTTQANLIPAKWKSLKKQRPNPALRSPNDYERCLDPNTLLVHRLYFDGRQLVWETKTYWRRPVHDGFWELVTKTPRSSNPLTAKMVVCRVP